MEKLTCDLTPVNCAQWGKQRSWSGPGKSCAWNVTSFIRGRLSRTDLFGFTPLWDKYWDESPLCSGPCCEKARAQARALPSHPPTYVNRCLIHTHTHMHARTQKPLTQHTHPSHFKGLSQKYSYTNSSEWNPLPKRMSSSLLFVWEYEALRCGIHRQMGAFFSLSVSLLRFCSHTRCCSVFCVHCGSCGFWHSENNNHSSSVQTHISCQKHRRRRRSSHRKWEDDSGRVPLHWKKKNHNYHHFICQHQQMWGGVVTMQRQQEVEPLVRAPGWCVLIHCRAKAFDSICAVGCSYKVQSWQSFIFS